MKNKFKLLYLYSTNSQQQSPQSALYRKGPAIKKRTTPCDQGKKNESELSGVQNLHFAPDTRNECHVSFILVFSLASFFVWELWEL